jgi:hypothetical protein
LRADVIAPTLRSSLRKPAFLAWIAALVVVAQAVIRISASPYDPALGEGNVEGVEAARWLWGSIGVAIVLVALGFDLRNRDAERKAA